MVKPNPWLLSGAIVTVFAVVIHRMLGKLNDAWNIW